MRKIILLLIIIAVILYVYLSRAYWFLKPVTMSMNFERIQYQELPTPAVTEGMNLLKVRKDNAAWSVFTKILVGNPNDIDALWGKGEVLRRKRNYKEAETIFNQILTQNPKHTASQLSVANIRYSEDRLDDAQAIVAIVLQSYQNKENEALAYLLLGNINTRRAARGGILDKINYGTQIKCYLDRAKEEAPQLPEIRLALGTFYLRAPILLGGNMNKAFEELNAAVTMAPDYASVNARLAQCYRKKGDFENYTVYRERAEDLDPEDAVLLEMKTGE